MELCSALCVSLDGRGVWERMDTCIYMTVDRMLAARDWMEWGMENHCFMGTEFQPVQMEKPWRWREDMVAHGERTQSHGLPHFQWQILCCVSYCCCSVAKLCPTLYNLMDCSTPGFPVLHCLLAQTHIHWVSDAIQPSHPLSPPFPPALNLSQHQGLFQWGISSHQVAKVLCILYNN